MQRRRQIVFVSVIFSLLKTGNGFMLLLQNKSPHILTLRSAVSSEEADIKQSTNSSAPDMNAYASGYKTVFAELPFKVCLPSEGAVPEDLRGTYYRAGPAMFSAGSIVPPKTFIVKPKQPPVPDGQDPARMVKHPFEGDGAVLGVTFSEDGQVTARFRFVRTVAFTNERKKGQKIYTGMESTREMGPATANGIGNDFPLPLFRHHLQPGLNKFRKNTSNTRVIYWGKRLLSLWEGGQPYKIDALALSTEGKSQLGGAIPKESDPFGSKMVYDPKLNRALFYSVASDARKSRLALYEFDGKFRLVREKDGRVDVDLPGFAVFNDFAATENYAIFLQPNIVSGAGPFMLSKEPGKALRFDSGPATLHLIPRVGSSRRQLSLPVPVDSVVDGNLQFCNAYEDGNTIFIDAIRSDGSDNKRNEAVNWPWVGSLDQYRAAASKKSLWRFSVDVRSGTVTKRLLYATQCLFGVVNPSVSTKKHRYIYMNVGSLGGDVAPPQGIAKFDVETETADVWMPESYEFCGEPMYAPRVGGDAEEDSGYILSVLYNGRKCESEFLILDAAHLADGPIARLPLGLGIPHGLFGCFTSAEEARWPADAIERRAKLADKMESRGNMWNEVKSDFSGLGLRFDDMEEYFGDFFS